MNDKIKSIDDKFCINFWKTQELHTKWKGRLDVRSLFVLHDGPPYANGEAHMGHALNKILKDYINKFKAMQGYAIDFIPGWDCKGLPIESKAERELLEDGISKDSITANMLRSKCKNIAEHYIKKHKIFFEDIGITMNDDIYTTIDSENELKIVQVIHDLARAGLLYRTFKPVMWSCEEGTSLAAAEIEYRNRRSTCIYMAFKIRHTDITYLKFASIPIWTTTPWTIPMNQAVACNSEYEYLIVDIGADRFVLASTLLEKFCKDINKDVSSISVIAHVKGSDLINTEYMHPMNSMNCEKAYKVVVSDHVTADAGTGFVHIAPDHGEDDFIVGKQHNLQCLNYLKCDGCFINDTCVPEFLRGKFYLDANQYVIDYLEANKSLLSVSTVLHSYPHSWRSRKPLIYRATKQWFIDLYSSEINLMKRANEFAHHIQWLPDKAQHRFLSILNSRKEWCISRQRTWGIPIPLFFKKDDTLLTDRAILDKTFAYLKKNGVDSWWSDEVQTVLLGDKASDYEKINDIADVWLESGSTFLFMPQHIQNHGIDLLIEGSDQHRAWFQSGRFVNALYSNKSIVRGIKTHGFVTDISGEKMSKSLANGVDPNDLVSRIGRDGLRLWALRQDVSQDVTYSQKQEKEIWSLQNKIINTLQFMLSHVVPNQCITYDALPKLEQWILHRLHQLNCQMVDIEKDWEIHKFVNHLHVFCEHDLSKIYFDTRKDILYWDLNSDPRKIRVKSFIDLVFHHLVRMVSPLMPFAAEKAWHIYQHFVLNNSRPTSILLESFLSIDSEWYNNDADIDLSSVFQLRKKLNAKSEYMRAQKLIKDNKDLEVIFFAPKASKIFDLDIDLITDITFAGKVNVAIDKDCADDPVPNACARNCVVSDIELKILSGNKCSKCKKRAVDVQNVNEMFLCQRCKQHISEDDIKGTTDLHVQ